MTFVYNTCLFTYIMQGGVNVEIPFIDLRKHSSRFQIEHIDFSIEGMPNDVLMKSIDMALSYIPLISTRSITLLSSIESATFLVNLISHLTFLHTFFSNSNAEAIAEDDAKDFKWTEEHFTRDQQLFDRLGSSISNVVEHQHQQSESTRFNAEIVNRLFRNDPCYDQLLELAINGAIIDVDSSFEINSIGDPFRPIQHRIPKCMAKHAVKLWSQNRGLLFRIDAIGDQNLLVHKNPAHWFRKPDAKAGRFIVDASNASNSSVRMQLNGGEAKQLSRNRYGVVLLDTAALIFIGWMMYISPQGLKWHECRIYKDDITAAFPQFNFNKNSALLLGVIIATGVLFIYTCGNFGWTGCPGVFQVIAFALLRLLKKHVNGVINMFVDDIMGFGTLSDCSHDQPMVQQYVRECFGHEGAINPTKTISPTQRAVILGWQVDLSIGMVCPDTKGINKLLYVFFCFDVQRPQSHHLYLVLAAVAERYSNGIRGARCFVFPLHEMARVTDAPSNSPPGLNRPIYRIATSSARFCIDMWRIIALSLFADSNSLSVSLEMFSKRYDLTNDFANRSVYTVTDASGWRICCAIYCSITNQLLCWTSYLLPYTLAIDKFQNNREYLGVLISLMLFRTKFSTNNLLKPDIFQFKWKGDNKSALSWLNKAKCNSVCGQFSCLAVTWFQFYSNIFVSETEHLPGVEMGDIDHNSRDRFAASLQLELEISLHSISEFNQLMIICDPSIKSNLMSHHQAFIRIHELLLCIFKQ